jgi:hypothetical protein
MRLPRIITLVVAALSNNIPGVTSRIPGAKLDNFSSFAPLTLDGDSNTPAPPLNAPVLQNIIDNAIPQEQQTDRELSGEDSEQSTKRRSRISDEDLDAIIEKLKSGDRELTKLDLRNKYIGPTYAKKLAEAIKGNTVLQHLTLGGNQIGDVGAEELAEAIKGNTVRHLDLGGNQIGDVGAEKLAEAIKGNTALENLSLNYNKIGDKGAEKLAEAIKGNTALESLSLSYNKITDVGGQAFLYALWSNDKIKNIGINGNDDIKRGTMNDINNILDQNRRGVPRDSRELSDIAMFAIAAGSVTGSGAGALVYRYLKKMRRITVEDTQPRVDITRIEQDTNIGSPYSVESQSNRYPGATSSGMTSTVFIDIPAGQAPVVVGRPVHNGTSPGIPPKVPLGNIHEKLPEHIDRDQEEMSTIVAGHSVPIGERSSRSLDEPPADLEINQERNSADTVELAPSGSPVVQQAGTVVLPKVLDKAQC